MTRTVLFDTIAAGGGHVATARAMRDAVERLSARRSGGPVHVEVRDAMATLGLETQDRAHKRSWARLLRIPWAVRAAMRAMDLVPSWVHAVQARTLDALARRAADDPVLTCADLIVVNHGFLMVAYARARTRYGLETPVVTFATEPFDANALWAEPRADRVIAPSHEARRHLVRLGVPHDRIDVIGYPVAGAFLTPPTRVEARRRLGLPETGRWALLALGGEGVARRPEAWIDALLAANVSVQVVAGRNAALGRRLGRHPEAGARLRVAGYVDDVAVRLAAADVALGKAGPATVLEAVAVGRPFLATAYAGLNEAAVIAYLRRAGLGDLVPKPAGVAAAVDRVLAAGDVQRPDVAGMTDRLGHHLLNLADGTAAPAPVGLDVDPWAPSPRGAEA